MKIPAISRFIMAFLFILSAFTTQSAFAQGAGFWHTSGNKILDSNNQQVRISGLNWYGFETTDAVAHGLSSADYQAILKNVQSLGYNTLRVPFSNQVIETPTASSSLNISYYNNFGPINTQLQGLNSQQVLDEIIRYATSIGLKIILDNHRSEAGNSAESNGLWYTGTYTESNWIADWTFLANRYASNPGVIGFDLRNEPHNATSGGACWDCGSSTNDWHLAAQRAGNAVLGVNPKLLIFVEGTDAYNNDYYWWGGNLEGVANSPVVLAVPNQLVYSAHDYGPTEYAQSWFPNDSAASLNAVWTQHWAFIDQQGIAPVWLGEFGTTNTTSDEQNTASGSEGLWFQSLITFLHNETTLSWTYWAMNGEDNYGLLDSRYDPTPVNSVKQSMLASNQFALAGPTISNAPSPASNLTATASTSPNTYQINLAWTASPSSSATYTVDFGTSANSIGTVLASGLTATAFPATNLNPSTTYYFTVTAANASGSSAPTAPASATTQSAPAPNAPTNLSATASSASQINLSWTASTTGSVTYSVYTGASAGAINTLAASGLTSTAYSATGLTANTTYFYAVQAIANSVASASSNPASATTQAPPAPAAPTSLSATAVSSSQINLNWTASTTSGVTYSVYSGSNLIASALAGTSYQSTNLTASTAYTYTVTATAGNISSAASNSANATTQAPPTTAAPSGLSATAVSASQINLTWTATTAPISSGSAATYSVYSGGNLLASGLAGTSYQSTGLAASTSYTYTVTATANNVTSSASNSATATTQAATTAAPNAPNGISASPVSASQININWAQSQNQPAIANITYSVYMGSSSANVNTLLASGLTGASTSATGLTDGTTYWFSVKAVASGVSSTASSVTSATTQTLPATAPTNVAATTASASEIDLTWTAAPNNGATYSVYSGTVSGATNTLVASGINGTAYAFTGLSASTTYYFIVRSVSAGGTSAPSSQASATTQAGIVSVPVAPTQPSPTPTAPTAPGSLSASASSTSQVNLSWTASTAQNSTSAITYTIYTGSSAGSVSTVLASNYFGTSYTVSNLTPGSTTYYTVIAANSTGASPASNIASASTQAAAPAAPTNLTATATSDTVIGLSWTASAGSGVSYNVYNGSGAQLASGIASTSYQSTGLTASTAYSYTVKAVSAGGTSPASNPASATTNAASSGCHVAYTNYTDWGQGFTAGISITWNGSQTINSWTLTYSYSGNQQIYDAWSSNYSQTGQQVTLTNAAWNGAIAPGGTVAGIGFNANYSGTDLNPTVFYLNGQLCK